MLLIKQDEVEKSKKGYILLFISILEIIIGIYIQYGLEKTVPVLKEIPHYISQSADKITTKENQKKKEEKHIHKVASSKKENEVQATCTAEGSYEQVEYCNCGEEISRKKVITEPFGHDYMQEIIEPTCVESGYTIFKCTRCDNSYEENQVEALGHEYEEGVCTRCGYEDPEYVKEFSGEEIMKILSESVASDSGTYASYLGSKSISVFAEERHNCFSLNTAVDYNLWGGNVQNVVFNVTNLREVGILNFKIGGETGSRGTMAIDIFVDQPIGEYPDYTYEIEAAAAPVSASVDITDATSLSIQVTNHSSNQNRIVFFDFSDGDN